MNARPLRCLGAALAALALAFGPAPAAAQAPSVSLSGFATLGAVWLDQDDLWFYRPGVNEPGGDDLDFGPDTLAAVQGSLRLSDRTDVTLQLMSGENPGGGYDPRVTWAFLRHNPAPGLVLRAGRLRVPFLMLSDSLYVNYANPWVRPPVEVYGLNPFSDLDGVDLLYQLRVGDVDVEIHPYFGNGRITFPNGHAELRQVRGLNLTLTRDELSLHIGHGEGKLSMHRGDMAFRRMAAALSSVGLGRIAAELSGDDSSARFASVGFQWDDGTWQFIGEYVRRDATRYVTSANAWYLTAGRRFGSVTPFVTVARQSEERPVTTAKIPSLPQLAPLAAAFDIFLASRNTAQRSASVGVRWDFTRSAAFKTEFSRVLVDDASWGSFFPAEPDVSPRIGKRGLNMLSVSVDVAF